MRTRYHTEGYRGGGDIDERGINHQIGSALDGEAFKKNLSEGTGGGKSLGQKGLRPQPQSFRAAVKSRGWGYKS